MAERRMFAKTIVLSDAFLDMPLGARCLYFTLGMLADDDGFVNSPKSIMRQCGASNDDLKLLIVKKFIIPFEDGLIVIKHWRVNNYLRNDRYIETKYKDEKASITVDKDGIYHRQAEGDGEVGIPPGIPMVHQRYTEDRIGKDRIGKDRIGNSKDSKESSSLSDERNAVLEAWNQLVSFGIKPVSRITPGTKREESLTARLRQYGLDAVLEAIGKIKQSDFLQGKKEKGWVITFDWFVLPNNFPKVLEGNYDNRAAATETSNPFLKLILEGKVNNENEFSRDFSDAFNP